jgi:hypothetical protein
MLGGSEKNHEGPVRMVGISGRVSNWAHPKYESEALLLEPTCRLAMVDSVELYHIGPIFHKMESVQHNIVVAVKIVGLL